MLTFPALVLDGIVSDSAPAHPAAEPRALAAPEPLARLAAVVARTLDVPLALVSLVGSERPFASAGGSRIDAWRTRRDAPLSRTLCGIPAASGRPLVLEDAREHPPVRENPALWLGEIGYAGAPVRGRDGVVRGVVAAVDARRRAWSDDEVEMLVHLAGLASLALEAADAERRAAEGRPAALQGPTRGGVPARMLEKAVETMQLGVTITDPDGRIVYTNPAEARMHGYEAGELVGRHARVFAPAEQAKPLAPHEMGEMTSWCRETVNVRRDGSVFPVVLRSDVVTDAAGTPLGIVTCCEDVTQRKEMERQLLRNAFYDPLTGLPNRGLLATRLELAIDRARRGDGPFALLVVGLDRFKLVNDSLGHRAGDELLVEVGRRLRARLSPDTMVAHLGADEFALLLDETHGLGDATRAARGVQELLAAPFTLEGREVFTGASIGIALSQTGYRVPDDVLRDATLAMYRCKAAGQGQYEVFDQGMHAEAMARLKLETDLRRAVEREEFCVHYQPIVSLETGRIAGFEALARWNHPGRGLVLPDDFIPLAEETGLILPIGMWVLERACEQLARMGECGEGRLTIAVNLSARQFAQPDLVERVAGVLERTGIDPATLKLEITESVIMQHSDGVTETLHRLKALGLQLYIDDFGTGYSSLSYLHRLPLDALKIDRSFVSGGGGGESLSLVRAIVALAHALDVKVVTEGIESEEVLRELRTLRCEYGQGYLFSRPVDGAELERLCARDPQW